MNFIAPRAEPLIREIPLSSLALAPENVRAYATVCGRGEVRLGRMFVFETLQIANPRYIINFPTKRHWRESSRSLDIEAGLKDLTRVIRARGIRSIAVPPLGSGLGGLDVEQRAAPHRKGFARLQQLGGDRFRVAACG